MSTTQQARHHTEADIANLEKQFKAQEKADIAAVKKATKDLKYAEKALRGSEKATHKAVHTHDKAIHGEHKMEKKMHNAINTHEDSVKYERQTAKDINVRKDKQHTALEQLDVKKAALQRAEEKKEVDATNRDTRFQALSAASATGPSAA